MVVERWFVSGLGFWFVVELLLVILVGGNGRGVNTGGIVVCGGCSSSELCWILLLFSGGGWSGCFTGKKMNNGKRVLEAVNMGFGWWRQL
uniref:Transmembrane protein n=1 Tax=Solanum tuberosum TaxID=4113 RepID=M1CU19_SOLTU